MTGDENERFIGYSKVIGTFRYCCIMLFGSPGRSGYAASGIRFLKTAPAHYRKYTKLHLA